jgi:hypothetical protein
VQCSWRTRPIGVPDGSVPDSRMLNRTYRTIEMRHGYTGSISTPHRGPTKGQHVRLIRRSSSATSPAAGALLAVLYCPGRLAWRQPHQPPHVCHRARRIRHRPRRINSLTPWQHASWTSGCRWRHGAATAAARAIVNPPFLTHVRSCRRVWRAPAASVATSTRNNLWRISPATDHRRL